MTDETVAADAAATPGAGSSAPPAFPENWKEAIPEDIRAEPSFARIPDVPALARSYVHAQKMVGADKIAVPPPDAPAEVWDEVYGRLGRPESAKQYNFERPDLPEGFPEATELEGGYREQAHKLGLNQTQAQGVYDWFMRANGEEFRSLTENAQATQAEAKTELQREFGNAYDRKLVAGKVAAREIGGETFAAYLEQTRLGDDPVMIRFLAAAAEKIGEDTAQGGGAGFTGEKTPAEAQAEIAQLQSDAAFQAVHRNKGVSGHDEAVERMRRLFASAYPEQVAR